jgi:hypothetical protein
MLLQTLLLLERGNLEQPQHMRNHQEDWFAKVDSKEPASFEEERNLGESLAADVNQKEVKTSGDCAHRFRKASSWVGNHGTEI